MMDPLTIYTKDGCGYCSMLKDLLNEHQMPYIEINISEDSGSRDFVLSEGHRTVPQIYQNGELFVEGGYTGMKQYLDTLTEKVA
jgi:glutaredoxin 3